MLSAPELITVGHDVSQFDCGKPVLNQWLQTRALIVNAFDDEAADFWRWHGFFPTKDDPHLLFRSMGDIAASLRIAHS